MADLAGKFVLCRIVNMRGVDLDLFQFDYDLTWAALFMNADGKTYGRFGGRDATSPDKYLTLAGLKHAMRHTLELHQRSAGQGAETKGQERPGSGLRQPSGQTPEQFASAKRLKQNACIHCHQVYDFRREDLKAAGQWIRDEIWVYPLPENIGLTVDAEAGNRIHKVQAESPAARTGLEPGDVVQTLNRVPIGSFADVQFALHQAPAAGAIPVVWQRAGKELRGTLTLASGWRETDISWRESMWGLEPAASVFGEDLGTDEKRRLGIPARQLAFRQGKFVPPAARLAGIRENDIVLGIDDKRLDMNMRQFNAYIRLKYRVGDRVTFNVLREGRRLDMPMTLPARSF